MVNILKLDWINNYGFYCKLSVNYKKKKIKDGESLFVKSWFVFCVKFFLMNFNF